MELEHAKLTTTRQQQQANGVVKLTHKDVMRVDKESSTWHFDGDMMSY